MKTITSKIRLYWPLIKSLQTGLLLATGIAGYLSSHPPFSIPILLGLSASLFLAISGSTIMNMWYDRDIDAKMKRTHKRPAASGQLDHREVFAVGLTISFLGIGWAFAHRAVIRTRCFRRLVLRCDCVYGLAETPHVLEHFMGRNFGRDADPFRACACSE